MNSFFFELIYDYLKNNNKEAAQKIAEGGHVNRGGAAVIDGIYYPRPMMKVQVDLVKECSENPFEILLSRKSGSKHYKTCYELYCHIMENKPIRLSKLTLKDNDSDESLKKIEAEDLETIIAVLTAGFHYTELETLYKNLKEQLQASLEENQTQNNLTITSISTSTRDSKPYTRTLRDDPSWNLVYPEEKTKIASIISNETGKNSAEFKLLTTFINMVDYGYALQGRMEQSKIFRENNEIDEIKYPIMHEQVVHALARGGHLDKIYKYIKTYQLTTRDFDDAIIKGLAAVGHHRLLEQYWLENGIDTHALMKGFNSMLVVPLSSCEYLRDEDALRMLIDAKDSRYKKILQEALSNSKVHLLNNHFKFWDALPQPEKNLDNHLKLDNIAIDFEPNNQLKLSFPPLQKNTLWIYADAIRQIMENRNMSYTEVVKTYFFMDENDNDPKPLPDCVQPCYQWANAFNCLYSNNLNPLLENEKSFEKRTILLQLTVEEIEKYIETIHLKPCDFTDDGITKKLNALSDFKQKTATYLGSKTEKNKKALSESAIKASAYFPKPEEIDTLEQAKSIGLGALLVLVGIVLLPTVAGAAYAWRNAYSFFKEAEGTRSNLEEIQEVLQAVKETPARNTASQKFTL